MTPNPLRIWHSVCGPALAIALITVGYQALRTARANPVNSLKSE